MGRDDISGTTIDMRLKFGYVGKQSILGSPTKWLTSAIVLGEDMASYRNSSFECILLPTVRSLKRRTQPDSIYLPRRAILNIQIGHIYYIFDVIE